MNPRSRLLGSIASGGTEHEPPAVDFGDLIRKLLVADQVIIESNFLGEFPLLAEKFGYDGLSELLRSRRLRVHCEALTMGEIGAVQFQSGDRAEPLPQGSYAFSSVQMADRTTHIHNWLQPINNVPGVDSKKTQKLRRLVGEAIITPPADSGNRARHWL